MAVDIPDDLQAFLRAGQRLQYDASSCEPGQIHLLPLDRLALGHVCVGTRPAGDDRDPHAGEAGYYYLPAVTVEHLTYLWESYFSWYEFHLNTLYALVVLCGMAIVLLFVRAPLPTWQLAMLAAVLAAASVATCRMLHKSAIRNMVSYEKNLVVMISRAIRSSAIDDR